MNLTSRYYQQAPENTQNEFRSNVITDCEKDPCIEQRHLDTAEDEGCVNTNYLLQVSEEYRMTKTFTGL